MYTCFSVVGKSDFSLAGIKLTVMITYKSKEVMYILCEFVGYVELVRENCLKLDGSL